MEKLIRRGLRFMRAGPDYVNNNRRYDKAYALLTKAYEVAIATPTVSELQKGRLCLHIGICLNENMDINPPVERNHRAIQWYKRGLEHIQYQRGHDPELVILRACLYNSLGVAYHHRYTRWNGGPIPKRSFYYYNKVRAMYKKYDFLKFVVDQVDSNSGGRRRNGGGLGLNLLHAANVLPL